jgi:hypothetical protein
MTAYDISFVGALCWNCPDLMPLLRSHLDEYEGLLPHLFMGDLTRWAVQRYHSDPSDQTLSDVLDFIESAFANAVGVNRELVSTSFLENLPRSGEEDFEMRSLLGKALLVQLMNIG